MNKEQAYIANALHNWANYIETGRVTLSAYDALHMGEAHLVKPLAEDQKETVRELRTLAQKSSEGKIFIAP
jgi:hypothetical protein